MRFIPIRLLLWWIFEKVLSLYEIPTKLFAMGGIEEAGRYMYYFEEEEREMSLFPCLYSTRAIWSQGRQMVRPCM